MPKPVAFRHSGRLGDIIYSLPAVMQMGGGRFYVKPGSTYNVTSKMAEAILPLLRQLPYVESAELWEGQPYDIDLDVFRTQDPVKTNLVLAHLRALGLDGATHEEPWLFLPPPQAARSAKVVISRSLSRPGVPGFWDEVLSHLGNGAAFVGTEDEYQAFCLEFRQVEFARTNDLLEVAQVIARSRLFVGNQSCPYAIAEGLKVPVIVEVDPVADNCRFPRKAALHVSCSEDLPLLGSHIRKMIGRRKVSRPQRSETREIQSAAAIDDASESNLLTALDLELQMATTTHGPLLIVGAGSAIAGARVKASQNLDETWVIDPDTHSREHAGSVDQHLVGKLELMNPLPVPHGHFACVLLTAPCDQLPTFEEILSRLAPTLRPDGHLICCAKNSLYGSAVFRLLRGKGGPGRAITAASLHSALWDAGFTPLKLARIQQVGVSPEASALLQLSPALNMNPKSFSRELQTRELVCQARTHPNVAAEPYQRLLTGPHKGSLGPAKKRCSIVIVTFNSMKTVDACLESVLLSLTDRDEVIIVDNASSDGTPTHLKRKWGSSVRVLKQKKNLGFSAACNMGARNSTGESIAFLNPDTVVAPEWLERMVAPLAYGDIGAVGPVSDRVSGDQFLRFHLPETSAPGSLEHAGRILAESNQDRWVETRLLIGFCLMLRRELLDRHGLFDEHMFLGSEDLELCWRLRTLGYRLVIASDVLVQHETSASFGSLPKSEADALRDASDLALFNKLIAYYGPDAIIRSRSIWGNDIFDPVIERALACSGAE